MIISPSSSHPFRIPVVRHYVAVIRELFVADCAYPVLLNNLPLQKLPHFSGGPEFPVSSWVIRIFDTLHSESQCPGLGDEFPTTAGNRFVDCTVFIATKPHGIPPVNLMGDEGEIGSESLSTAEALIQFVAERDHAEPDQSSAAVEDGKRPNAEEIGTVERGFEGPGQSRRSKPKTRGWSDDGQETQAHVSRCPQTNRRRSACTLGEMEGSQAEQVKGITAIARLRFSKP